MFVITQPNCTFTSYLTVPWPLSWQDFYRCCQCPGHSPPCPHPSAHCQTDVYTSLSNHCRSHFCQEAFLDCTSNPAAPAREVILPWGLTALNSAWHIVIAQYLSLLWLWTSWVPSQLWEPCRELSSGKKKIHTYMIYSGDKFKFENKFRVLKRDIGD